MASCPEIRETSRRSVRALEATNFFLADVQTGLGPFVAAYLAAAGWSADRVGDALTVAVAMTVLLQTPACALVDQVRSRRAIIVIGACVLASGSLLLLVSSSPWPVFIAQGVIGSTNPFLAPTLAALTMGLVSPAALTGSSGATNLSTLLET